MRIELVNRLFYSFSLKVFFFAVIYLQCLKPFAQGNPLSEKSKVALSLEGMAGISFGDKMVSFNVGGPNLLMGFGKYWRAGLAAFPSFFVRDSKTGARLGVGGRIDYKNFVLFTSFYHFDSKDVWVGTLGFGYKFHKRAA